MADIQAGELDLRDVHVYRLDARHNGHLATVAVQDIHAATTLRSAPASMAKARSMAAVCPQFAGWMGSPATQNARGTRFDPATIRKYLFSLRVVQRWLGLGDEAAGGAEDVAVLSVPDTIAAFRSYRIEDEGCAPATLNHDMDALRTLWRYLRTRPELHIPPADFPKQSGSQARLDYFTGEQFIDLAAVAEGEWWELFSLLPETGLRIGEVQALRWADVDLTAGTLQVRGPHLKTTSSERNLPLTQRACQMLHDMRTRRPPLKAADYLYDARRRNYWAARSAWKRLLRQANARLAGAGKMGLPPLRIHDLRHTFAIQLVKGGADLGTVGALMGHATEAMTLKYARFRDGGEKRRAIDVLETRLALPLLPDRPRTAGSNDPSIGTA